MPVSVADWSQVIASAEKPLEFLLRKSVAVFIKVRRDTEIEIGRASCRERVL